MLWAVIAWLYISGIIIYWAALPVDATRREVALVLLWPLIAIPISLFFIIKTLLVPRLIR